MATSQSQGQTEIKIPNLEDPEDHHLYVAYSKNTEDKELGQRIIAKLKKIKCWDSDVVYSSASQTNAMENAVDRCKAFLLILSDDFLNNGWLRFVCAIIQKKSRERYQPSPTIVVRVCNLDDVTLPPIVADVIKDNQVLRVDEVNDGDFVETIYRFISEISNPQMDVIPVSNVAIGLAWTFYYGYLQILLPGLPKSLRDHEKTWQRTPGERIMPRKAFLVVPDSCFCPTSLSKVDSLFVEMPHNKIRYVATRAGSPNRSYDLPVYKLLGKEPDEQTYYVQVQFATPILTMYEMYEGQIAGLRQQELYHQMHLFCYYLRNILRHSQTNKCHDKAIIICCDLEDKEENLLSRLVRERVKVEIDREEFEGEAATQEHGDTKLIAESADEKNVTFEKIAVSDMYEGRRTELLQRYPMKEKNRGKALILSVRVNRNGAIPDEEKLKRLWGDLEFEVDLRIDPTAKDMEDALISIQTVDHSQYSAFVCCILAHGYLGTVKGSDGTTAKITDLTYLLNNDVCPGLVGKPKMFFIQACQSDSENSIGQSQQSTQTDNAVEHDVSLAGNRANLLPGAEDFLMSYATLPGYKAARHPEYGAFYIKALDENIRKYRYERGLDLESILKLASSQVQSEIRLLVEASVADEEQFPFCLATMNKLIFL